MFLFIFYIVLKTKHATDRIRFTVFQLCFIQTAYLSVTFGIIRSVYGSHFDDEEFLEPQA